MKGDGFNTFLNFFEEKGLDVPENQKFRMKADGNILNLYKEMFKKYGDEYARIVNKEYKEDEKFHVALTVFIKKVAGDFIY